MHQNINLPLSVMFYVFAGLLLLNAKMKLKLEIY